MTLPEHKTKLRIIVRIPNIATCPLSVPSDFSHLKSAPESGASGSSCHSSSARSRWRRGRSVLIMVMMDAGRTLRSMYDLVLAAGVSGMLARDQRKLGVLQADGELARPVKRRKESATWTKLKVNDLLFLPRAAAWVLLSPLAGACVCVCAARPPACLGLTGTISMPKVLRSCFWACSKTA